jgi:chromosome partitioning protein
MRKSTFKQSLALMLMPNLSGSFTPMKTWTPTDMQNIRLNRSRKKKAAAIPRVITVRMAKGGVGKTTLVGNLGAAFAMMGHKILMIDGDPQASLTQLMGLNPWDEGYTHVGELMHRLYRKENARLDEAIIPIWEGGIS